VERKKEKKTADNDQNDGCANRKRSDAFHKPDIDRCLEKKRIEQRAQGCGTMRRHL
jgi:hypothetical protein